VLFNSYIFLFVFLPITFSVFFGLGRLGWVRAALASLVLASLVFYGYWNPPFALLLTGSFSVNSLLGLGLHGRRTRRERVLVVAGVTANLLLLGWFKYAHFLADTAGFLLGREIPLPDIFLPLGISFFTFQQIAYLVDAWQGRVHERRFLHYALFVCFFPQLIAGPIVHHADVMPQFARIRATWNSRCLAEGLTLFVMGLFKKVAIADWVAGYSNAVFSLAEQGGSPSFFEAWGGTLAYTVQIYFDFSGYSDMALGLGAMIGIRLPFNFNSPCKATSIGAYWRRWHITLGQFLRDYLYLPLGGNRRGVPRQLFNLVAVMFLGGLWHGAAWTFVVWGSLHGLFLVTAYLFRHWRLRRFGEARERVLLYGTITFLAVAGSRVFFRSLNFTGAFQMLKGILGLNGFSVSDHLEPLLGFLAPLGLRFNDLGAFDSAWFLPVLACLLWTFLAPNSQEVMGWAPHSVGRRRRMTWQPNRRWALCTAALALVSIIRLREVSEFIYFQF